MILAAPAAGALLVLAGAASGGTSAAARLRAVPAPAARQESTSGPADRSRAASARRASLACAVAGVAVLQLIGGLVGLVAGAVVASVGPAMLGRLESSAVRSARQQMATELPVAVDLLVAVVVAGATLEQALTAVHRSLGGPAGEVFRAVAAQLASGCGAQVAWEPWFDDPALGRLARAAVRAEVSGAPPAAVLARVAADLRARRRIDAEAAARRVSVLAVVPLGLCFLPAFVLLGVVPVVVGLASSALTPGP